MLKTFDEFRYATWARRCIRVVQAVLSITLVAGLNVLAAKHFERRDLTTNQQYSLAPMTRAYLAEIGRAVEVGTGGNAAAGPEPVTIYLTLTAPPGDADKAKSATSFLPQLRDLLREYDFDTPAGPDGQKMLTVKEINQFRDVATTKDLQFRYDLGYDTVMLVTRGKHSRALKLNDLYQPAEHSDDLNFFGERAVTSAILDVLQDKPPKIYFTMDHGEMNTNDPGNAGLTQLKSELKQRNISVAVLDSKTLRAGVPDDAAMVVIASPSATTFSPEEVASLRQYLDKTHGSGADQHSGRLLVFLNPRDRVFLNPLEPTSLDTLFTDWYLRSDNVLVLDKADAGALSQDGDLMFSGDQFLENPITHLLRSPGYYIGLGPTRPVHRDLASPDDDRRRVTENLLKTMSKAWGQRRFLDPPHAFVPGEDLVGPLSVAALSEKNTPGALDLPGGKILMFGNADFISNSLLGSYANRLLVLNAVDFMLDNHNLLNIRPRVPVHFQVTLTRETALGLAFRLALVPAVLAFFGGLVYYVRQR